MRMVYRRANCLERSTQAYEAASAGFPKDTELLRGLLACYVRQEQAWAAPYAYCFSASQGGIML